MFLRNVDCLSADYIGLYPQKIELFRTTAVRTRDPALLDAGGKPACLNLESIYSYETSLGFQRTMRRYMPEDRTLHQTYRYKLLLTYSRSRALLEESPIVQSLKNFPAFYGTRRFNIVFTRALHWSLSWAISIQSIPSYLRSILILSTHLHLGLASGLLPSGFPTDILYAFLI
jgi:hypothetical protein